jgi:hypothetical protein
LLNQEVRFCSLIVGEDDEFVLADRVSIQTSETSI